LATTGTGDRPEDEIGWRLPEVHQRFPFEQVLMLGDNRYGGQRPQDFVTKFEEPYRPIREAGVQFYLS